MINAVVERARYRALKHNLNYAVFLLDAAVERARYRALKLTNFAIDHIIVSTCSFWWNEPVIGH